MELSSLQAIFLGIIQGLSEFLPISSSGHLVLTPWLFGFDDPGLAFDVALDFGTLIAVVSYFWRDWLNIFHLRSDMVEYHNNTAMLILIIGATIPGVLVGFLFKEQAETIFRNPLLIASTLALGGLFLYVSDHYARRSKTLQNISWKEALIVGIFQAIAIIPGVSRSGITITAALLCGLDRVSAARFSFLLATPIIFGAAVLTLPNFLTIGSTSVVVVGTIASAVSGYVAIKYLIVFVSRADYKIFFWYRLALAMLVTALFFLA